MNIFKKLPKDTKMLKSIGIAFAGTVAVLFVLSLVGSSFHSMKVRKFGLVAPTAPSALSYDGYAYDYAESDSSAMFYEKGMREEGMTFGSGGGVGLSARNVYPGYNNIVMGDDAEKFEVTDYSATIETRNAEEVCTEITDLKKLESVIFESSNTYDRGCSYSFKVKQESVEAVLAIIKELDPKDLSVNTQTIKRLVDDYTSETEILEKKRDSIEATLEDAIRAYDEITKVASRAQDAVSLAKIIESKIQIIERLTSERININEQLDRLSRSKAEQLDRIDYTYFNVSVYENKFIDGESLADSWKMAFRNFVQNVNKALQDVTINLVACLIVALQYVLYAFILLAAVKYGWRFAKKFWQK